MNNLRSSLSSNLRAAYGDYILKDFPHHIVLGPNLHSKDQFNVEEELISEQTYYETSPFNFTLPVPLLPMKNVPKSFLCGIDPVKRIVEEKAQWQELLKYELTLARKSYGKSVLTNLKKKIQKRHSINEIRRDILLLAKIFDIDPDDQFSGFYNWYYCGGNLNHISIGGNKFLLQPGGKKCNVLEAVPLVRGKNVYMVADSSKRISCSLETKEPILQIITEKRFVGVRQRKKCLIYSLSDELNLSFIKLDEEMSLKPFTSIDFDKGSNERYLMMKTDSSCSIKDLRERKIIREWKVPDCSDRYVDKWCSAIFGQNRDTILCVNRQYLRTYDARARYMNCMELCPIKGSELLENCEEISCAVEGCHDVNNPLIYVSTYHHLFAMDLRFPRAFVQRWSHGMKHAPCYLTTSVVNNANSGKRTEVVLLGSQITKEIHAVINDFSANDEFEKGFSSVFPICLPSQAETLDLAQWHGKLLNPRIQKRFSAVTTGICCFKEQEGGIICFQRNAIGDVFQQHVLFRYSQHHVEIPEVLECFSNWQKSEPKKSKKKLETVIFADAKKLFDRITDSSFGMPKKRDVTNKKEKWKISKNRTFSYYDMLAPKLLKVWEVEDEDEWDEDEKLSPLQAGILPPLLPPSQEPTDKVQEWLGQNIYASTPIASQENRQDDDSKLNLSLSPINNRVISERKKLNRQSKASQKKRFVHGF